LLVATQPNIIFHGGGTGNGFNWLPVAVKSTFGCSNAGDPGGWSAPRQCKSRKGYFKSMHVKAVHLVMNDTYQIDRIPPFTL